MSPDSPHIRRELLAADYTRAHKRGDRAAMKRIGAELRRVTFECLLVEVYR